jgi:hypothetical protein
LDRLLVFVLSLAKHSSLFDQNISDDGKKNFNIQNLLHKRSLRSETLEEKKSFLKKKKKMFKREKASLLKIQFPVSNFSLKISEKMPINP